MTVLLIPLALLTIYVVIEVIKQLWKNKKAHQFYQEHSKNLFILPNCSIFSGHMFSSLYGPRNWQKLDELHAKYGKTIATYQCVQPWVLTTDLDLIKHALEKNFDRQQFAVPYQMFRDSIFQVAGDDWRRMRRAVAPAMTNYKVRSEAVTRDIENIIQQLKGWLDRRADSSLEADSSFEVDTVHMAKRFSLAVVILVAYKKNHVVQFETEYDTWTKELGQANSAWDNPLSVATMMFPFLMPVLDLLVKFHKIGRYLDTVVSYTDKAADLELAAEKRKKLAESKRSLDLEEARKLRQRISDEIIETYLAGKISYRELQGSLFMFIIAGFETVASAISHLCWQFVQHPEIQEKCRDAVLREGFDSEYLYWCIMEALRIFPPVPLGFGRVLETDFEHAGQLIPKGTFVTPSVRVIHRDPAIWPEPDKFKPERWAKAAELHPAAFLGFGLGQRNCVGGKLAMHELKLVFQMLLTNFRLEKTPETPDKYDFISPTLFFTDLVGDLPLKFVPLTNRSSTSAQA